MARRQRDYRKEYARRVKLGKQRGLSRAAARGHPRAGERPKRETTRSFDPFSREERALKMVRKGTSLRDAASRHHMSQERLRSYLKENVEARWSNRTWRIIDRRTRQFPFYSNGEVADPWMPLDQASDAGEYMRVVKQLYLPTGDNKLLEPFSGKGVRDVDGKFHPYELDENTLYELDHRGEAAIPELYRIGN
jgi:hypothetical protein